MTMSLNLNVLEGRVAADVDARLWLQRLDKSLYLTSRCSADVPFVSLCWPPLLALLSFLWPYFFRIALSALFHLFRMPC